MLERVVISRRTSEQELDLLMLLEEDAPEEERARDIGTLSFWNQEWGEAQDREIVLAVSEWLATIKDQLRGHDRFQLAVARNALGMVYRNQTTNPTEWDQELSDRLLAGEYRINAPELLAKLRLEALTKLEADVPKYPALVVARQKWTGEH